MLPLFSCYKTKDSEPGSIVGLTIPFPISNAEDV